MTEKDIPRCASDFLFGDGKLPRTSTGDSKEMEEYGGRGAILEESRDGAVPALRRPRRGHFGRVGVFAFTLIARLPFPRLGVDAI